MEKEPSTPHTDNGTRTAVLHRLARMITGVRRPHPVRVGVDGFSASGKSTLAAELAAVLADQGRTCLRADLDDFKRPRTERPPGPDGFYRGAFDLDAIRTRLLAPLGPGGDRQVQSRYFDQQQQALFPAELRPVAADAIVIADGGYLLRPGLRDLWDLRIFVEIDFDLVLARGTARDSAWMNSEQEAAEHYRRYYIPAERLYDAEADPRAHADVIMDNRDVARPVLREGGTRRTHAP
ncbi:uridylate kinase [Streptomyces sp. CA-111067]|uniref:uridylate kinase n=1 Tax=Streptomyces sp. CA-111067 TaxID=3240046 RepID=UPI003D9726A3